MHKWAHTSFKRVRARFIVSVRVYDSCIKFQTIKIYVKSKIIPLPKFKVVITCLLIHHENYSMRWLNIRNNFCICFLNWNVSHCLSSLLSSVSIAWCQDLDCRLWGGDEATSGARVCTSKFDLSIFSTTNQQLDLFRHWYRLKLPLKHTQWHLGNSKNCFSLPTPFIFVAFW